MPPAAVGLQAKAHSAWSTLSGGERQRAWQAELVGAMPAALRVADQGDVYGKTGEAEVEGGSHAWFVGYRGDLAFASLVVLGGSSDNAVAVTKEFFDRFDAPVSAVPN